MGYRDDFDSVGREAAWTVGRAFRWLLLPLLLAGLTLGLVGQACGWFGEAAVVAREEFGPRALLEKYGWFKDAAATLDKKRADLGIYDRRFSEMAADYGGKPRSEWAREDREAANVLRAEADGVRLSYNRLAAEYNAAHAKFHWRFADVGMLPQGATVPIPREFAPYETK